MSLMQFVAVLAQLTMPAEYIRTKVRVMLQGQLFTCPGMPTQAQGTGHRAQAQAQAQAQADTRHTAMCSGE